MANNTVNPAITDKYHNDLKMPLPKYHLYILQLCETGHFYIGVTSSPKQRDAFHFTEIKKLIYSMRDHELFNSRKKNKTDFNAETGFKVHSFFAKKIKPRVDSVLAPKSIIKWHYSFTVKASTYTSEEVRALEDIFLSAFKGSKMCLNEVFKSSYVHLAH